MEIRRNCGSYSKWQRSRFRGLTRIGRGLGRLDGCLGTVLLDRFSGGQRPKICGLPDLCGSGTGANCLADEGSGAAGNGCGFGRDVLTGRLPDHVGSDLEGAVRIHWIYRVLSQ